MSSSTSSLPKSLPRSRHHVDVRLLHLQHRAAGIGELFSSGFSALLNAQSARSGLYSDRRRRMRPTIPAIWCRTSPAASSSAAPLSTSRILQVARPQGADDARKHARLEKVVQDVAARIGDGADIVDRGFQRVESPTCGSADSSASSSRRLGRHNARRRRCRCRARPFLARAGRTTPHPRIARGSPNIPSPRGSSAGQHRVVPLRPRQGADDRCRQDGIGRSPETFCLLDEVSRQR